MVIDSLNIIYIDIKRKFQLTGFTLKNLNIGFPQNENIKDQKLLFIYVKEDNILWCYVSTIDCVNYFSTYLLKIMDVSHEQELN